MPALTLSTPRPRREPSAVQTADDRGFQGFVALALAVLVGLVLGVGIPLLQGKAASAVDLEIGLLGTLTLLPTSLVLLKRDGDLLAPLPVVGGLFFLYFAVRAAYLAHGSPDYTRLAPNLGGDYEHWIGPAVRFNLACWGAAMAGYLLPIGGALARRLPTLRRLRSETSDTAIVGLWAVGIAFRLLAVAQGNFLAFATSSTIDHSTQSYVGLFSRLDLVALFLLGAKFFRGTLSPRLRVFLFAVALPLAVLFGFITGSKLVMLFPLIYLLAAMNYFRRRLGLREIGTLLALLVFVVMPLGEAMRESYAKTSNGNVTEFDTATTEDTARLAVNQVQNKAARDPEEFLHNTLQLMTDRVCGLDSSMVALKMTPAVLPWLDPAPFYLMPVNALIPRIVWPSKPIMRAIPDWETDYWGQAPDSPTTIATTNAVPIYLAFGWTGAMIGMLLLGAFWRVLYDWHRLHGGELAWCSYFLLLHGITDIEGDVTMVYVGLTRTVILVLIIAFVAGKRPQRLARR